MVIVVKNVNLWILGVTLPGRGTRSCHQVPGTPYTDSLGRESWVQADTPLLVLQYLVLRVLVQLIQGNCTCNRTSYDGLVIVDAKYCSTRVLPVLYYITRGKWRLGHPSKSGFKSCDTCHAQQIHNDTKCVQ